MQIRHVVDWNPVKLQPTRWISSLKHSMTASLTLGGTSDGTMLQVDVPVRL
jgi:hypothetical protein